MKKNIKLSCDTLEFTYWLKDQESFWACEFEGTIPDTRDARWQYVDSIMTEEWVQAIRSRSRGFKTWQEVLGLMQQIMHQQDPPIKRWRRFIQAKQGAAEHWGEWIERVEEMANACEAKEVNEKLIIALIIALGGRQDKVQDKIFSRIIDLKCDLNINTFRKAEEDVMRADYSKEKITNKVKKTMEKQKHSSEKERKIKKKFQMEKGQCISSIVMKNLQKTQPDGLHQNTRTTHAGCCIQRRGQLHSHRGG